MLLQLNLRLNKLLLKVSLKLSHINFYPQCKDCGSGLLTKSILAKHDMREDVLKTFWCNILFTRRQCCRKTCQLANWSVSIFHQYQNSPVFHIVFLWRMPGHSAEEFYIQYSSWWSCSGPLPVWLGEALPRYYKVSRVT